MDSRIDELLELNDFKTIRNKLREELSELMASIYRNINEDDNIISLVEELADVKVIGYQYIRKCDMFLDNTLVQNEPEEIAELIIDVLWLMSEDEFAEEIARVLRELLGAIEYMICSLSLKDKVDGMMFYKIDRAINKLQGGL